MCTFVAPIHKVARPHEVGVTAGSPGAALPFRRLGCSDRPATGSLRGGAPPSCSAVHSACEDWMPRSGGPKRLEPTQPAPLDEPSERRHTPACSPQPVTSHRPRIAGGGNDRLCENRDAPI